MKNTALLVIDVQNALMEDNPYNGKLLISNIKKLIQMAENHNMNVIYVRHDGGKNSALEKDSLGWQIYNEISPGENAVIFDKSFNSAFKETGLHEHLKSLDIKRLILTGMQTEYCIDATCKSAYDLNYEIIIPKQSTTTYDNDLISAKTLTTFFEDQIWQGRFASVIAVDSYSLEKKLLG